jgi:hypothetical protein
MGTQITAKIEMDGEAHAAAGAKQASVKVISRKGAFASGLHEI